jgi:hypothetical protein
LYPALVQCFGIILLGYLAGKFSFINDVEAKVNSNLSDFWKLPASVVDTYQGGQKWATKIEKSE